MFKRKYVTLNLSAIAFAFGFSSARPGVVAEGLTLGEILFCLFLVLRFLEEESTLNEEQKRVVELARKPYELRQEPSRSGHHTVAVIQRSANELPHGLSRRRRAIHPDACIRVRLAAAKAHHLHLAGARHVTQGITLGEGLIRVLPNLARPVGRRVCPNSRNAVQHLLRPGSADHSHDRRRSLPALCNIPQPVIEPEV